MVFLFFSSLRKNIIFFYKWIAHRNRIYFSLFCIRSFNNFIVFNVFLTDCWGEKVLFPCKHIWNYCPFPKSQYFGSYKTPFIAPTFKVRIKTITGYSGYRQFRSSNKKKLYCTASCIPAALFGPAVLNYYLISKHLLWKSWSINS
jgi:hypothetical protein